MFSKILQKLPVPVKTILGLVLTANGIVMAINANLWSGGSLGLLTTILSVAVIYLVVGTPALIEGLMAMLFEKQAKGESEVKV